jgi:tetratricopeptide (TPR) repeat protein
MNRVLAIMTGTVLLAGCSLWAQAQAPAQAEAPAQAQAGTPSGPPLTEKEVVSGLKSKAADRVVSQVSERGVDFDLTPEIEKRLRKAKADDTLIDIIRKMGPTARAQAAKQGAQAAGPKITPEEYQAFRAIQNELEPDKALQLVGDFEKKFPNSSLLSYAYMFAANAYSQKNDVADTVTYGEKSVKLKEDNLPTLIMLSSMLPQPQFLKDHAQEKEKYLDEAANYADRALKLIGDAANVPRQPNESDEQYGKRKNALASGAHASLGMVHLERSQLALQGVDKDELVKAENEFQQAITLTDRPNPQDYYRLGEAYSLDGKLDDAIQAFSKAGDLGQGGVIKTYADQRVQELQKRKAQPQAPAKP